MLKVATNIFNSPVDTGPGNFGRRLANAISAFDVSMLPCHSVSNPDVFLGNAFLDGHNGITKTVLRVDGPGIKGDIARVKSAHKDADYIIYQSEYSRNVLQQTHLYQPDKSYVINNGTELPTVYHDGTDSLNVLSICHNWSPDRFHHAYHAIYSNLTEIVKEFPKFKWNIIGNYQLFKDAMSLNPNPYIVEKHIRFVEFTPDLDRMRRTATFCIHLVGGDSCPNSVIESMSYALPCIVWYDSAGPELIDFDQGGLVLGGHHSVGIISTIKEILDNYEQFSQSARRLAEEKFDINIVARKYAEVLHAAA